MRSTRGAIWVGFLAVVIGSSCFKPPLDVYGKAGELVIDVRTLGEYPTSLGRLRLSEEVSKKTVWDFMATRDVFEIWEVRLRVGKNSTAVPESINGTTQLLVPLNEVSFTLEAEKEYRVEVWGKSGGRATAVCSIKSK
jgi:hypothetical protein